MDLPTFFAQHPRAALAFSGGTDSAYLLRAALSAALPCAYQDLLDRYDNLHLCRLNLETEAMFQAAFAAGRELR